MRDERGRRRNPFDVLRARRQRAKLVAGTHDHDGLLRVWLEDWRPV